MQFHRKFVLRVETGNLLRHLCFVETKSWWPLISVQGNKLSPVSWARAGPHLGGEHDGPGDLEHGVGPRGLRPAGAHQGQQVGGAQQGDQDHQCLGYQRTLGEFPVYSISMSVTVLLSFAWIWRCLKCLTIYHFLSLEIELTGSIYQMNPHRVSLKTLTDKKWIIW